MLQAQPCHTGAVKKGDLKMAEILLNYRAKSSTIEPSSGLTAMTTAFSSNGLKMATLLLQFGGNPDAQDKTGKSARDVAKRSDLKNALGIFDDGGAEAFEV
jgi:ankyrin repeat protein